MAKQILANGESFGSIRSKINGNFSELYNNQGGTGSSASELKELYLKDVFDERMFQNVLISGSGVFLTDYDQPENGRYGVSVVVPVREGEKYLIDRSSVIGDRFRFSFSETLEISNYQELMGGVWQDGVADDSANTAIAIVPRKAKAMVINLAYQQSNWDISGLKIFKSTAAETKVPPLWGNFAEPFINKKQLPDLTTSGEDLAGTTPDDIHNQYDALMAEFPDIVSKRFISNYTEYDGSEATDYSIYEYTIQPPTIPPTSFHLDTFPEDYLEEPPTFLITTGLHGNEKLTVWAVLEFIRQMLQDWQDNPVLASMKANVKFKIIPVASPGGYKFDSRYLRDGEDPNRYFKEGVTTDYVEVEALKNWLEENRDAYFYFDFHIAPRAFIDTRTLGYKELYSSMIRRMSMYWNERYDPSYSHNYTEGVIRSLPVVGLMWEYAYDVVKMPRAMLLEIYDYKHETRNNMQAAEKTLETVVNFLLAVLHNYHRN